MPSVLFVCTANRFRSPLAEAAFKQCLFDDGCLEDWDVWSAGTWTESGLPPAAAAVKAARRLGLDIERHRSQSITSDLLLRSDLVIVMQASQQEAILVDFPHVAGKTMLLSEIVEGIAYDIPDPIETLDGSDQELATVICNLVKQGYKQICVMAQKRR